MVRRTKDEAEKTRDAILDAAETVFYTRGVTRTTLEQIAEAAGVTRGAIYWHFKDKVALCEAMLCRIYLPHEDMLAQLAADTTVTPLADLQQACLHSLHMIASDKRRQKVIAILKFRCEYVEEMASFSERLNICSTRMMALSEKLFARAKKLGMLGKPWTPRKAAATLQALMNGLIVGGLELPEAFNFSTTGPACVKAFFASLQAS
jgi:AcrR family transcriptional regulator